MTGSDSNEKPIATAETETPAEEPASHSKRAPYRSPKLRHLGSVRELTLGSTTGMTEGAGTFMGM